MHPPPANPPTEDDFYLEWRPSLAGSDFPAVAYERLLARIATTTPFNRLAWLRAAEAVAEPGTVAVLLLWRAETLVACLPLVWSLQRVAPLLAVPVVRHLGYPLTDRLSLAVLEKDAATLSRLLTAIYEFKPVAYIELNEVFPADILPEQFCQFVRQRCSHRHRQATCLVPEHWLRADSCHEAALPDKVRYELRRARRRVLEAGGRVERIAPTGVDDAALRQWLEPIMRIEQASWKGNDGVGVFSGAVRQTWMRAALTGLAEEGRVRIVALTIADQWVSYRLGLLEGGRLYDYNIAFLPEYAKLGSGRLLLDEWLRWAIDEGWQVVDASRVSRNSGHQLHERMNGQIAQFRERFFSKRPSGLAMGGGYRLWAWLKPGWRSVRRRFGSLSKRSGP